METTNSIRSAKIEYYGMTGGVLGCVGGLFSIMVSEHSGLFTCMKMSGGVHSGLEPMQFVLQSEVQRGSLWDSDCICHICFKA